MMKPLQLLNSKKKKGVKTISMKTKIGYGEKDAISTAIENTTLDEGDIIITSDTEEMAFVKPDKNPMFIKSRSTKEYTLNGTDLGALSNGQSIPAGTSIDDLLNMITQKAVHPTYTAPTVSIAKSGSGTASGSYETGTSITPILAATFNKNDAGDLTKLAILKGTEEVGSGATSPYTYTGDVFVLGDETITYKAQATYADGPVKNNNLNQPDATGQIKAGTKDSSNFSFTGQRNLFWGTGVGELPEITSDTVRGLANKKLNPTQGYSWNIPIAVGQQYVIFAYKATLRDVNEVMYVETNDTGMAASFTKTTIDVADARGGENGKTSYKVYSYHMAAPAAATMTFKVTL